MSEEDVAGFLAAFACATEPVDVHFLWRPLLTDPDDELVLECAVNCGTLPRREILDGTWRFSQAQPVS